MNPQSESSSDEFSGRLGLIFATIGAAIGTGNIWRFPRMVGANGGGSFLDSMVNFLVPLVNSFDYCRISHFGKEVELELLEPSEFLQERNLLGWDFGRHGFLPP